MSFAPSDDHTTWRLGLYRERVTTAQLNQVLLTDGNRINHGTVCEWHHRRVGPGVHEIWLEKLGSQSVTLGVDEIVELAGEHSVTGSLDVEGLARALRARTR